MRESDGEGPKTLTLVLRYGRDARTARSTASVASRRPGRRVYVRYDRIPRVRSGMGISILSHEPRRHDRPQAREQRVGGELLCEVW